MLLLLHALYRTDAGWNLGRSIRAKTRKYDDNFFEIGGHSLAGMRILARVQDLLNISLPLHTLFESPTVESLTHSIETVQWAAQNRRPLTLPDEGEREVFVL